MMGSIKNFIDETRVKLYMMRTGTNCPKCHSYAIEEIGCSTSRIEEGLRSLEKYPERPTQYFECSRCRTRWENEKFIKYLTHKILEPTKKGRI